MIQQLATEKCHVMPSRVKRFMKQTKRLKSSLQRRGSMHVYKMADRAEGESQMYVYFVIFRDGRIVIFYWIPDSVNRRLISGRFQNRIRIFDVTLPLVYT